MERKTSANVETIQRLYQSLSQGDAQGIAALCTTDVRWEITPGFSHSATFVELEAIFNDFFGPLMQEFESWRTEPETFLDAGDHVIALRHYADTVQLARALDRL